MSNIKNYYSDYGITKPTNRKELNNEQLYNLFKEQKKDTKKNMPKIQVLKENTVQQADLLFLPHDQGYKYLLVVVDSFNKKIDAEPLKSKKTNVVAKAFDKIYKRDILKLPKRIEVDSGKEFKADVKKFFDKHKVFMRIVKPSGRFKQFFNCIKVFI